MSDDEDDDAWFDPYYAAASASPIQREEHSDAPRSSSEPHPATALPPHPELTIIERTRIYATDIAESTDQRIAHLTTIKTFLDDYGRTEDHHPKDFDDFCNRRDRVTLDLTRLVAAKDIRERERRKSRYSRAPVDIDAEGTRKLLHLFGLSSAKPPPPTTLDKLYLPLATMAREGGFVFQPESAVFLQIRPDAKQTYDASGRALLVMDWGNCAGVIYAAAPDKFFPRPRSSADADMRGDAIEAAMRGAAAAMSENVMNYFKLSARDTRKCMVCRGGLGNMQRIACGGGDACMSRVQRSMFYYPGPS